MANGHSVVISTECRCESMFSLYSFSSCLMGVYNETSLQRTPSEPQDGVRYMEVLPKLVYFISKTYSKVLEYSAIETKVCQKVSVGRRKSPKTIH